MNENSSSGLTLDSARRSYAERKARKVSSMLQETFVAKFEVDHLPSQRQVYEKRGSLLYLVPREEAREKLEARERRLGEQLTALQDAAADPR